MLIKRNFLRNAEYMGLHKEFVVNSLFKELILTMFLNESYSEFGRLSFLGKGSISKCLSTDSLNNAYKYYLSTTLIPFTVSQTHYEIVWIVLLKFISISFKNILKQIDSFLYSYICLYLYISMRYVLQTHRIRK